MTVPPLDAPPTNLANREFWETEYFGDLTLSPRPDPDQPFDRCLMQGLSDIAPVAGGSSVVEIGCAPARWLVYYAETFGASVKGIEYSPLGADISRRNLERAGIAGTVDQVDFFEAAVTQHDLVLSLGFIEHFDDLERAFVRHVDFCAPGGRIVIGVPNLTGLNGALQRLSDPAHLAIHNRRAMEPGNYVGMARNAGVEPELVKHIGGFDPIIIKIGRRSVLPFIVAGNVYRRWRAADSLNHRLFSSYLLMSFRRPSA